MYPEAVAEASLAAELSGNGPRELSTLAYAEAACGQEDRARAILDTLLELSGRRYVSEILIAVIHLALGDHDSAFKWLEKAYKERAEGIIYLKVEPKFDPLRDDPRFEDLLRRLGVPE